MSSGNQTISQKDTRKKILLGALVLDEMDRDEGFANWVRGKLPRYLTRDIDRELFGLSEKSVATDLDPTFIDSATFRPSSSRTSIDSPRIFNTSPSEPFDTPKARSLRRNSTRSPRANIRSPRSVGTLWSRPSCPASRLSALACSFMARTSQWFEKKDELLKWREGWAELQNRALERAGALERVDHRSHAERGIELEPQTKRYEIPDRIAEHEERARRNGEKILEDPTIALDAVSRNRAVFTRADVGRWLNTHTADAEQFQKCLSACMASDELVQVGTRTYFERHHEPVFTTRENLAAEKRLLRTADALHASKEFGVSSHSIRQAEGSRSLSDEQRAALRHVCAAGGIAVVEGRAGAGKSYMLGAAREAWEASGRRVLGGALAGKAAEGLEASAGIRSRSLAAWEYAWDRGRDTLKKGDVLVIDEAGMVGSRQLDRVLSRAQDAGAKVVLVGDPRQLQAIQAGSPMRKLSERLGA
ncbi:MAG: AAA family ATPase, partial [Myxococcota bacterium]